MLPRPALDTAAPSMGGSGDMDLRRAIAQAGGLVNVASIARRWGISRTRASQLAEHPTFPEPVYTDESTGRKLWAADEVDAWRVARASEPEPEESK